MLKAADVENAAAYLDPLSRQRLILYNEDFVRNLEERSKSFWTARAILAHEVAHHANGHLELIDPERRKQQELEADKFAGAVLFRLGATEEAAVAVFQGFREGESYPRSQARVAAAKSGWWSAAEQSGYDPSSPSRAGRVGTEADGSGDSPTGSWIADAPDGGADFDSKRASVSGVSSFDVTYEHRPTVPHYGGAASGPGLQFFASGRLTLNRASTVQLVVYFSFPDGSWLFANPQESHYRAVGDQIATGSDSIVLEGFADLSSLFIKPIPYYALNLVPTSYNTTYWVVAQTTVLVDGVAMGQSQPIQISLLW